MPAYRIRDARPEDLPARREIIRVCFGDTPQEADLYLRDEEGIGIRSLVAEQDGQVVSTFCTLPGVTLRTADGRGLPCPYLYALGTLPERRRQGIGMAVFRAAYDAALAREGSVCVAVFEEELKAAYARRAPLRTLGHAREAAFSREELLSVPAPAPEPISPEAYGQAREAFLRNRAHAEYAPAFLRLAARFGYVFLRGPGMLAVAERRGSHCLVPEVLAEDGAFGPAAAAVAAACPAERYTVRTPLFLRAEHPVRAGDIRAYVLGTGDSIPADGDFWHPLTME